MKTFDEITVYTDGGCDPNPGLGAWAYLIIYSDDLRISKQGAVELSTNQKMELTAAIGALTQIDSTLADGTIIEHIRMFTDSDYVRKGITEWIFNWIKNGWKTSKKQPVENQELWKVLYQLTLNKSIEWNWVKSHSGETYNTMVDDMVVKARQKTKEEMKNRIEQAKASVNGTHGDMDNTP